jgi:hypothetical protein
MYVYMFSLCMNVCVYPCMYVLCCITERRFLNIDTRWQSVLTLTPRPIYRRGKLCRTKWIGGWMSRRAGPHALENRKLFVSVDNRTIFRRLYTLQTGHYTDWAITDHIITTTCICRLNTSQPTFNTYFTKPTRHIQKQNLLHLGKLQSVLINYRNSARDFSVCIWLCTHQHNILLLATHFPALHRKHNKQHFLLFHLYFPVFLESAKLIEWPFA